MRHIGEVLRLAAQGLSQHEISASVGISRTSVHNYLERTRQAGLSWPLPEDLDAAGLEARLFRRTDEGVRSDRPEPNWLEVHHEHKRGKHVTLQLLHLEYKAVHPEGLSYTQFCVHYRRWRARQDVVMRLEYAAGERMFVDFAGDGAGHRPRNGRDLECAGVCECARRQWLSVCGGDQKPGPGVVVGRPHPRRGVLWWVGTRRGARQP